MIDAKTREFLRLFVQAGRIPGSPWEPMSVPEVRPLVAQVWKSDLPQWWDIQAVDRKIVDLSQSGVLSLHEHDFPQSVTHQSTLLRAGGRAFCLVAIRHDVAKSLK